MRIYLNILFLFSISSLFSQLEHDENISRLIVKYSDDSAFTCEINVAIDVEGMQIPNKTILVDFKEGEKPKVKGKGIALLPKKGMIDQFKELFETEMQAILMKEELSILEYKLVSLDEKSKWVTADISFDKSSLQISKSIINTRKQGSLTAEHSYADSKSKYPIKSVLTFEVKKFKIPLRFIGRENNVSDFPDKDELVFGKITLIYKYLE